MKLILAIVLLTLFATPLVSGQCAIQPIKPIPPIGCKDLTPQCVSDGNARGHWTWICVSNSSATDSNRIRRRNDSLEVAAPPKLIRNTIDTPLQEPPALQAQTESGIGGEMDAGERQSTDQLRAIAEAVKSCQPPEMPDGVFDSLAAEGFKDVYGPPVNVVWNVEPHTSIRSRYTGSIDFGEPSYMQMPLTDDYCKKPKINKSLCRDRWEAGMRVYRRQVTQPIQFKYEFDVTNNGLELLRVFKKDNRTDNDPWVAGDMNSDVCATKAIRSVLNNPTGNGQMPRSTSSTLDHKPSGVPENLWIAANSGDSDAQFYLGILYQDGKGVPQDYAEAYFWLDLAVSGKPDTVPQEDMIKARDTSASRLTPEVLLQTQTRARKWMGAQMVNKNPEQ